MASRQLIDAQFDRAVEIVQSLPKNGPIQTGYEEKLTMYSLYKQATVGNVQGSRPGMFDMLGRAKWDEWAKHKDLDPHDAKSKYIEALLKVLRRYSDKTVAMDLVRELESYGDPSAMVMSGSFTRSRRSSSSGSTTSDEHPFGTQISSHLQNNPLDLQAGMAPPEPPIDESGSETDEAQDEVPPVHSVYAQSHPDRPGSSLSSQYRSPSQYHSPSRYRTPIARSLIHSPPSLHVVPATQPLAEFQAQSAFGEPSTAGPSSMSHPRGGSISSMNEAVGPYPGRTQLRTPSQPYYPRQYPLQGAIPRPASRTSLERAIESLQVHMHALSERVEGLEHALHLSSLSPGSARSPGWIGSGRDSARADAPFWDLDDMGMWSLVLHPLVRALTFLRYLVSFIARKQSNSPAVVVTRRLILDISFLLCALAVGRMAWRRSGMRRREVLLALLGVWRALVGHKSPRALVDRGV